MRKRNKNHSTILHVLSTEEYKSAPQIIKDTGLAYDHVFKQLLKLTRNGQVERIKRPRPAGIRTHRAGMPITMPAGPPVEWAYRLMDES